MTEHKSFKRKVRARMAKTGERYGAARRVLLQKGSSAEPEPGVEPPELSDEAVREATGRDWAEWCAELDAWGATARTHTEIARHVNEAYGVPGWWAQSVAVGYERIRGLRAKYQRQDGTFVASASKTFAVPQAELWEAVSDETRRAAWLPDADVRLRTATPPKVVRLDWLADGSRVALYVSPKGEDRSHLAVEHAKLADAESVLASKAFWKERLSALVAVLEG
jgi:hypothetical protein